MLTSRHAEPRFVRTNPRFRRTRADVSRPAPNDQTDELGYLERRVEQELELAIAASHPRAEAIHMELARAYRARARALRTPQQVPSWLNEGEALLLSD